jgi:TPP-dependent pyruvate/acetoin dehydrogenase alpha subunit
MCKFDTLPIEKKLKILETMYLCRIFEEKIDELFSKKMMYGTTHLATGQEANHVGLCAALDEEDWVVPTHRSHGFFLAKGGSSLALMAEMFGLRTGADKGLGGSMHLMDPACNLMCSTAMVGVTAPLAFGMALALKQRNEKHICVSVFGDGAANQGMVLESFNLASVWSVPVLFYCENNLYGMSTLSSRVTAGGSIAKRAAAFDIKTPKLTETTYPPSMTRCVTPNPICKRSRSPI